MRDIQFAINSYPNLPATFEGPAIIKKWIDFFVGKQATDQLSEGEIRQMKFDIENIMNQFNEKVLGNRH